MKPVRVGICGLGTVGGGTFNVLTRNADDISRRAGRPIVIEQVAHRSIHPDCDITGINATSDVFEVANNPNVDVLVELIGGYDIARELVLTAIANGKHVVTANKALIAVHGNEIFRAAHEKGVIVAFEAAVAGGIPVIKSLREGLGANRIEWVAGIINGTGNFILTHMRDEGRAFEDVLAEAKALGYAESDPTFDVEGIDAAHKLTILAAIAFGQTPQFDKVAISGIRDVSAVDFAYAKQLGFRIKLVGTAEPGRMPRMQTCLLPMSTQLAKVDGVLNAVEFDADPVGSVVLTGPGAGSGATSSAVLSDLVDLACDRIPFTFGRPVAALADGSAVENGGGPDTPFYVRLMVVDKPGVLADITSVLQIHDISVESMLQQGRAPQDTVALVLATHEVGVERLMTALTEIESLSCVMAAPVAMPILVPGQEG